MTYSTPLKKLEENIDVKVDKQCRSESKPLDLKSKKEFVGNNQ